jgi:hypothetical protein
MTEPGPTAIGSVPAEISKCRADDLIRRRYPLSIACNLAVSSR